MPQVGIFGWGIHWLILFFVLSIAFGFALKHSFGVTILALIRQKFRRISRERLLSERSGCAPRDCWPVEAGAFRWAG